MKTRVISAVVAVLILAAIAYFFGQPGLLAIGTLAAVIAMFEYARMTMPLTKAPFHIAFTFMVLALAVFAATVWAIDFAVPVLALGSCVFASMVLLLIRRTPDLDPHFKLQSLGVLGLVYCGVFFGLAVRLLLFENGSLWLFCLLAVVFSGDTFAYLTGSRFGRRKLLEAVSPKKTIEGALGGLAGSAVAGALVGLFVLPSAPPVWAMISIAITTGAFAQMGDLFESVIKRVADVKDSGAIMPGHGGILDRIDGVIFGAPAFYIMALFFM